MAHDQQRPFGAIAFQSCDQIGARRILRGKGDRNALGFENLPYILGDFSFVPRRIGAIDPDQSLKMTHGFFIDLSPVRGLSGESEAQGEQSPKE